MQVILLERVEKLGIIGDVVNVKPGFARNFLLPRGKALRATNANKEAFESQRVHLEADNLKQRDESQAVSAKMADLSVILIRQAGEAGHLYGSVNARDIAASITDAGFTVKRNQIGLADPIKMLGLYEVSVQLHPEVSITVGVNVARSDAEADMQAKTGGALLSSADAEAAEAKAEMDAVFAEADAEDEAAEAAELGIEDGEEASEDAGDDAGEETAE